LALAFYDTSKAKTSGHVVVRISSTQIIQSGANEHDDKVGISDIDWLESKLIRVRTFLTAEELESVTTGEQEEEIMIVNLNGINVGEIGKNDVLIIRGKDTTPPVKPPVPVLRKARCTHVRDCNVRTGRGGDYNQYPKIGAVSPGEIVEVLDEDLNQEYIAIMWDTDNPTGYVYGNSGAYFEWV
jgi:hypothetical protein